MFNVGDVGAFITTAVTRSHGLFDRAGGSVTKRTAEVGTGPLAPDFIAYQAETVYEGAVFARTKATGKWEVYNKNMGHLGPLDDPEQTDRLHGMHKFSAGTMRV